jgi:hypothetical protein
MAEPTSAASFEERLSRALPASARVTELQLGIVIELAYLTIAADGVIAPAEVKAFQAVARAVRRIAGLPPDNRWLRELLRDLRPSGPRASNVVRMRQLGIRLTPVAKELAFRASMALSHADGVDADVEFEFELDLREALDLPSDDADRWASEVHVALG